MHRNDKAELNILSLLICAAVMYLTAVRRVTNPACGMQINGANTVLRDLAGETGEPGIRNPWRYSTSTGASVVDASRGRRSRFRAFSVQRGVGPSEQVSLESFGCSSLTPTVTDAGSEACARAALH